MVTRFLLCAVLLVAGSASADVTQDLVALEQRGVLQNVVYGASATDLTTVLAAAIIFALIGVAACWARIRSALRLDPRAVFNE